MVKTVGAKPISCIGDKNFNINIQNIKSLITPKTKMIIINSPNNPTGKIVPHMVIEELLAIALKHNLVILSDEIYSDIVFPGYTHSSFLSLKNFIQNGIYVNGFSKTFAMTGWRLGYIISNEEIINSIVNFQQHTISCPTTFIQYGALASFTIQKQFVKKVLKTYSENRELLKIQINLNYTFLKVVFTLLSIYPK